MLNWADVFSERANSARGFRQLSKKEREWRNVLHPLEGQRIQSYVRGTPEEQAIQTLQRKLFWLQQAPAANRRATSGEVEQTYDAVGTPARSFLEWLRSLDLKER